MANKHIRCLLTLQEIWLWKYFFLSVIWTENIEVNLSKPMPVSTCLASRGFKEPSLSLLNCQKHQNQARVNNKSNSFLGHIEEEEEEYWLDK